jgi:hypothetical protein
MLIVLPTRNTDRKDNELLSVVASSTDKSCDTRKPPERLQLDPKRIADLSDIELPQWTKPSVLKVLPAFVLLLKDRELPSEAN